MEVIKGKKTETKTEENSENKKELERLLYRKHSCETLLPIWSKGITLYTSYIDMLNVKIESKKTAEIDKHKYQVEIYNNRLALDNLITQFKLTQREYKHFLLPKIEKLASEKEKKKLNFDAIDEVCKTAAQNKIFATKKPNPANVELVEVNQLLDKHVTILEKYSKELQKQLEVEKDLFKISQYQKEMFDISLALTVNSKRLENRIDYYENQFLPAFKSDMAECKKLLPKYLERAKEFIEINIDPKLKFLLDEHSNHKKDEEQLWLFYTALRERVDSIIKELSVNYKIDFKNSKQKKKFERLLTPLR
tara:strand:+ start:4588 stop:5508 length:921 start_codon:yes stop_codon:yes gene_type:complete